MPHPGTFLIDRQGRVVERAFEANYRERVTGASLLARLGVNVEPVGARSVAGKQLSVELGTSDEAVAPGKRVTLIIDVTPGPKMHVYAPGQPNYIPISVTLGESADYRAAEVRFPTPTSYFFEPLNETVQVYGAPFRITQEVTLGLSRELRERAAARETLTITGELAYQACDDTVCYRPDTVRLAWSVRLIPFQQ